MANAGLYEVDSKDSENERVWIRFYLSIRTAITLKIYASDGETLEREITTGELEIGEYTSRANSVFWDCATSGGSPVASGVKYVGLFIGSDRQDWVKFYIND